MTTPPPLAPWLPANTAPHVAAVVRHALARVGVCEMPLGSNRSGLIDEWARNAGAALGSFWCANFATECWRAAGLPTAGKGKDPSCDLLMAWAKATGRWSTTSSLGALVFYGPHADDATHVAVVVRLSPVTLVVGGNERFGAVASRNGVAVQLRAEQRTDILGYAHPFPRDVAVAA
jgi:hypothetical protein